MQQLVEQTLRETPQRYEAIEIRFPLVRAQQQTATEENIQGQAQEVRLKRIFLWLRTGFHLHLRLMMWSPWVSLQQLDLEELTLVYYHRFYRDRVAEL